MVGAADLTEYDFCSMQMGQQPEVAGFRGEQRFTRALLDLAGGERPRVLFTTGHGEISLDDRSDTGLGQAQRILGDNNFDLEEWSSLGAPAVPEGTDLVVIAGPTSTFLPPELDLFSRYLDGGGRMLVLLDPPLGAAGAAAREIGTTGLEDWLRGYGVDAGPTWWSTRPTRSPSSAPRRCSRRAIRPITRSPARYAKATCRCWSASPVRWVPATCRRT